LFNALFALEEEQITALMVVEHFCFENISEMKLND
jgi:hypothetical protein